ncbi:MAG: OmpA family protein [Deltaproteobacteria bacterium]|nr:OmpA family protein [Deltaproteobacteria bacterium]
MEAIFFDSNVNSISQQSAQIINRKTDVLKNTPEYTITLEGYSDIIGDTNYNIELSKKRAQIVKDYLIDLGIDPDKIRVVGKGGTEKYGKGETNEALGQNRRVNLIIDIPPEPKIEVQLQDSEELSPAATPEATVEQTEETPSTDSISQTEPSPHSETKRPLVSPSPDLFNTIEKKVRVHTPRSIVFNTPTEMQIGKSYLVEADVAHSFIEALSEDLGDNELDNNIGINLAGNGFEIAPELENDQNKGAASENGAVFKLIDKDSPLTWKWLVTPVRGGIGSLILSIAITVENSESGSVSGEYAIFQRVIEVRPNMIHAITSSYWIMGVLIVFIIAVVAWILIRKVSVDQR